jgi:nucleotide-binding universal stress UspA family protein
MTTERSVLVGFDGSADAQRALLWAADEAVRTEAPLRVVVVDHKSATPWEGNSPHDPDQVRAAEKILSGLDLDDYEVRQHKGHVAGTLLELAESAGMVVLGSHGHGRVAGAAIGSVTQHVTRHAPCTVVVVRPAKKPDSARIVVGVDGSPTSHAALEYACGRAERTGEAVVAVHGWKEHTPSSDVLRSEPRSVTDDVEQREVLVGESIAGIREAHPDVVLATEAIPVAPGPLLVDASADATLVVVGARGHGFFEGLQLGSVTQDLIHRAQCPVAVVR